MSAYGTTLTVLVTQLIDAVVKDEAGGGIDISAGLLGEHTSEWLRDVAENVTGEKRPAPSVGFYTQQRIHLNRAHDGPASGVTNEDRRMVAYFIRDKDDITRWTEWEDRKEVILAAYPGLSDALSRQVTAECLMNAALRQIDADDTGA